VIAPYFDPKFGGNRLESCNGRLSSGVNSASVAVDTDSDTGFISGLDFKPFDMTSLMNTRNVSFQQTIVDVPANFPIPGVTHIETRSFEERFTITGVAPATPTLASSTTSPLKPSYFQPPLFVMTSALALSSASFSVEGTYEVIGPETTRTVPFSVEYEPVSSSTLSQRTGVMGGQNFDDGFEFLLGTDLRLGYQAANPVVFDEVVDGVRFRALFPDSPFVQLLKGVPIPEPGSISLALGTAVFLGVACRRRMTQ